MTARAEKVQRPGSGRKNGDRAGGDVDQGALGSPQAVRTVVRGSPPASALMPCNDPSATLERCAPQTSKSRAASARHECGVDLQELPGQCLALERFAHLRLDALEQPADAGRWVAVGASRSASSCQPGVAIRPRTGGNTARPESSSAPELGPTAPGGECRRGGCAPCCWPARP